MPYINTIQWKIEATPERIKQREKMKKYISYVIYFLGLTSVIVFLGEFTSLAQKTNYNLKFSIGFYVLIIIIWHRFGKNKLNYREKLYTLSNNYLEIHDIKSNKAKRYKWEEFRSYSKKSNFYSTYQSNYNKQGINSPKLQKILEGKIEDLGEEKNIKYFYLRLKKEENNQPKFVKLEADQYYKKISEALKIKLPEK